VALAVAVTLVTGGLSRVPLALDRTERAVVRLSWRSPVARVEECRKLSEEELAARPAHMRRPEVCEGQVLPYMLTVRIDGEEVAAYTVRPSGVREDRPVYVFREVSVAPGRHRISVAFTVADPEDCARGPGASAAVPPPLRLDANLVLPMASVALIMYDEAAGRLVVRQ
jgi:hypothetical protein